MSILKASILFSRAGTVYNQVKVVATTTPTEHDKFAFSKLLREMELIYASGNTRENREDLHLFIKTNALDIAKAYSDLFDHRTDDDNREYYSLKEE